MNILVSIVIVLIVVGVLLWLVESVIPMDGTIKMLIKAVVIVVVAIWLLGLLLGYAPAPNPVFFPRR